MATGARSVEEEEMVTMESLNLAARIAGKQTSNETFVRVPPRLYQAHPEAYTPLFVSVGPFHNIGRQSKLGHQSSSKTRFKDVNLLSMETKKQEYTLKVITRSQQKWTESCEEILEICRRFVQESLDKLWSCYSDEIEISPEILANIMLVDGCFLLQFLYDTAAVEDDIMFLAFRRDVVLLENQIPMFVLQGLGHILEGNSSSLASKIMDRFKLTPSSPSVRNLPDQCVHLLDLICRSHHPLQPANRPNSRVNSRNVHLRHATELRARGVTFRSVDDKRLLDLSFSEGVFWIPPLCINDYTETLLINLLAHEHLSPNSQGYFTSYMFLMKKLIESTEDLQVLEKGGVIINMLGTTEDATKIFSNVCKQFVLKNFCYGRLCSDIEDYVESTWQTHVQVLKDKYFGSPWTTISVFAATILLMLTVVQTIFTVLSYYQAVVPK